MDTLLQSRLAKIIIVIVFLMVILDMVVSCVRQDQLSRETECCELGSVYSGQYRATD